MRTSWEQPGGSLVAVTLCREASVSHLLIQAASTLTCRIMEAFSWRALPSLSALAQQVNIHIPEIMVFKLPRPQPLSRQLQ